MVVMAPAAPRLRSMTIRPARGPAIVRPFIQVDDDSPLAERPDLRLPEQLIRDGLEALDGGDAPAGPAKPAPDGPSRLGQADRLAELRENLPHARLLALASAL